MMVTSARSVVSFCAHSLVVSMTLVVFVVFAVTMVLSVVSVVVPVAVIVVMVSVGPVVGITCGCQQRYGCYQ